MGLLSDLGPIQTYEQSMQMQNNLKKIAMKQFARILKKYGNWKKSESNTYIKWGEEIQGHFLRKTEQGQVELWTESMGQEYMNMDFLLQVEYGKWMFEMVPAQPYNTGCNLNEVISSIRHRYRQMHSKSRLALTIPVIPSLGTRFPAQAWINNTTKSIYVDDSYITPHPRYVVITEHGILRKGSPIDIFVPIFQDIKTDKSELSQTEPKENFIHLDTMAFGMGSSCLQCTFSTKSLDHARYLYDQLNVLSPIMLAMTAGTAFYKGKVSDWDVRWNVISACMQDRTENQRNPQHTDYLPTSRYTEANYYLSNREGNLPQYNDFYTGVRQKDIAFVKESTGVEMDDQLAFHLANLSRRDYLMVNRQEDQMDQDSYVLFQLLNGTNWNSVRLKIPINDEIGWRVEFRTMEIQLTADENAAYCLLMHLIVRLLHENQSINLYLPITKLRENFERAHRRDALRKERFYFRTNIYDKETPIFEQLSIFEILFGKESFKGLFTEIEGQISQCSMNSNSVKQIISSLKTFLEQTASGQRLSLAQWQRSFVNNHPDYKHNSILSDKVMNDLLLKLNKISKGEIKDQNFNQIFPEWAENACRTSDRCSMRRD